ASRPPPAGCVKNRGQTPTRKNRKSGSDPLCALAHRCEGAYHAVGEEDAAAASLPKRNQMEWDRIEGKWQHFKGNALRHWGKLTADQLDASAGNREQLARKIQEAYRIPSEAAEKQLAAWQHAQRDSYPFRE